MINARQWSITDKPTITVQCRFFALRTTLHLHTYIRISAFCSAYFRQIPWLYKTLLLPLYKYAHLGINSHVFVSALIPLLGHVTHTLRRTAQNNTTTCMNSLCRLHCCIYLKTTITTHKHKFH